MNFFSSFLKQDYQVSLLAPDGEKIISAFKNVQTNPEQKLVQLRKVQVLRAESYVQRGILEQTDLTNGSYYPTERDPLSWHLLVEKREELIGCIKFRVISNDIEMPSKTFESILRLPPEEQTAYLIAYEAFKASAKGMIFGEVTNWLINPIHLNSRVSIFLALSGYSFFRLQGESKTLSLVRDGQMTVETLLRIGGKMLGNGTKGHYDPYYKACQKIITFYSEEISEEFKKDIGEMEDYFKDTIVFL